MVLSALLRSVGYARANPAQCRNVGKTHPSRQQRVFRMADALCAIDPGVPAKEIGHDASDRCIYADVRAEQFDRHDGRRDRGIRCARKYRDKSESGEYRNG